MKTGKFFTFSVLVLAIAALAWAGDTPWFDMKNCDVCKAFSSKPGLTEHMNRADYKTSNGAMIVIAVPNEYKSAFKMAESDCHMVFDKANAGEKVTLDGYCSTFNQLAKDGAKVETFNTPAGEITLITSTDPTLAKRIQEFSQRTTDEWSKMHADMTTSKMPPTKK